MANLNNKYNNSFIYTIRSPHTDKFYIGSTTQKLCKRFANHKASYNSYLSNVGNHVSSYKIIELGDSYIELLEEINCDTKTQLEMCEGELIRLHKDLCVNKSIAGRTITQYNLDNADILKQYKKKYYANHADNIKQYQHQYRLNNTDKSKQYCIDNADNIKQYKKQYNIDNADKKKQYNKQYHLKNKTPKINSAKEDYDLLIHCDKLMNLQYSYKKLRIILKIFYI